MSSRSAKEILRLLIPAIWETRTDSEEFEASLEWLSNGFEKAKESIDLIDTLYDVNTCPVEYLPYLAYFVGINLEYTINRDETFLREQIRQAVAWYRLKGTVKGMEIMFLSLGFTVDVEELWWDETYEEANLTEIKPTTYSPFTPEGGSKSHYFDVVFSANDPSLSLESADLVKMERLLKKVKPLTAILRRLEYILTFTDVVDFVMTDNLTSEYDYSQKEQYPAFGKLWCLYHGRFDVYLHNYSSRESKGLLTTSIVSQASLVSIEMDNANLINSGDYIHIDDSTNKTPPLLVDYVSGSDVFIVNGFLNKTGNNDFAVGSTIYFLTLLVRDQFTVLHDNSSGLEFVYRGDAVFALRDGATITDRTGNLTYTHPNSGEVRSFLHDYNLLDGYDRSCGGQDYFKDGYLPDTLSIDGDKNVGSSTYPAVTDSSIDVEGDVDNLFSSWPSVSDDFALNQVTKLFDTYDWGERLNRGIWDTAYESRDGSFVHDGEIADRSGYELREPFLRGTTTFLDRSGTLMENRDGTYLRDGAHPGRNSLKLQRGTLYAEGFTHNYNILTGHDRSYGGRFTADNLSSDIESDIGFDSFGSYSDSIQKEYDSEFVDIFPNNIAESVEIDTKIRSFDVFNWGEEINRGIWDTTYEGRDGSELRDGTINDRAGYELREPYLRGDASFLKRDGAKFPQRNSTYFRNGVLTGRAGRDLTRGSLFTAGFKHNYNLETGVDRSVGGRFTADSLDIEQVIV